MLKHIPCHEIIVMFYSSHNPTIHSKTYYVNKKLETSVRILFYDNAGNSHL
jgi:hypothetical protein